MSFSQSLSIADDMAEEVNKEAREISANLLVGLTRITPLDTGSARGNWFAGINNPNRDIDLMRKAFAAISDGLAVFSMTKQIAKQYPTIIISNNLPYIERLNAGYSEQAPIKFVEKEIDAAVNSRGFNVR